MRFPGSESSILELKRDIPPNNQIVKTAIAFCNTNGGKIVIGVEDDGRIVGLSDTAIEDAIERLETAIFDSCTPHIIPKLYAQRLGDKSVLIIEMSEGMNKPYYLHTDGVDKGTYIRLGRHTIHAIPDIIQELQWQSKGIDFEKTPVFSAPLAELDNKSIEDFIKNRKNAGVAILDDQTLKSYGLISYDQSKKYPSVAGVLLFGREPQSYFSEAMIICSQFKGNSGRETIATVDCEGTLFNQFKQAFEFITSRLSKSFTISGLEREEKLEIPEVAIREALLNIIVHRNYHLKSPSKIAIYENRVEFFSPGRFPGPFLIENVLSGITYLRNPAICKVLREANYIEKLGSGIIAIFSKYEEYGLETPQLIDGGDYVKCILPRDKKKPDDKCINDDTQILELFNLYKEISVKDVERKLLISRSTALRRLNDMIKEEVIERVGHKRSIRYRLNNQRSA
jgi:ATP-dependent DNA helicase RecG